MNEYPSVALDIGGSWVRAAIGIRQRIIARHELPWPAALTAEAEVELVVQAVTHLVQQTKTAVQAVGVSLAALVDEHGVVVSWPNRPHWRGLPFRRLLQAQLGVPVIVEDDANTAALAEYTFGAGQGYQQMLFVIAGTGIGGGLMLNGQLFRGRHGWAGELGHQMVVADGPLCPCGNRGCVQMVASGRTLDQVAQAHGLQTAADLVTAAQQGAPWATTALVSAARWLGLAVANVANLLDLEAIVVGGGLSRLTDPWWSTLVGTVEEKLYNRDHRHLIIKRSTLTEGAGLLGALRLGQLYTDEQHKK